MSKASKIKKVNHTCAILEKFYGVPVAWKSDSPLDALVAVILSQNTSDKNSFPAFAELKRTFPTWEAVMNTDERKIAVAIRRGGLANIKAKRIKQVLGQIVEKTGKLDISFLSKLSTEDARQFLLSLNGVGPKSAAVVLNFAFGKPAFPVDTHVYRVSKRLGLIGEKVSRERAHEEMEKLVPDQQKQSYLLNLIRLGREVCHARKPKCGKCPLKKECKYYVQVFQKNEVNVQWTKKK